ncbi:MAG: AtpZ/AtpI family protein [Gammaproteobacteria bacterium]
MIDSQHKPGNRDSTFGATVGAQAARKLKARRASGQSVWFGLGMIGIIGWSVTVPTLLGAALGLWLDKRYAGQHSWTLALLMAGLVIGCFNAWHWVAQQGKATQDDEENGDE